MKVNVQDGKFEAGMRKFKKKVQESGLLQELRDREMFGWFLRMSESQIMESDLAVKYLLEKSRGV